MKKVIFINFLIVIALIIFLEVLTRTFNIVGKQGYDQEAFYSEKDITFSKPNKNFIVYGIETFTDEYGFRVPSRKFSYLKNKNFQLILGDSVTYGVGVREENSFVGLLRSELDSINLLNTAIFGHNLESYLYVLKKNSKKFEKKIDKVIIFLCLNDIVPYQGVIFKGDSNNDKVEKNLFERYVKNKLTLKLNVFLREKSSFFVLLKSILTNPVKRHYNYMNVLYNNNENLSQFEKYIQEIQIFSKKNSLDIEFVLLPYAHQVINDCRQDLLKPQNQIKKIFNKLNLELKDYTDKFCEESNKKQLFLTFDPVHLSKDGHKYVFDLLRKDKIIN